jgi:Ribonuclease G/E
LKENWTRARPEEEVKKVVIPEGQETYILCRTSGRREKEKAIRERFCSRMEEALKHLEKSIATGRLKDVTAWSGGWGRFRLGIHR